MAAAMNAGMGTVGFIVNPTSVTRGVLLSVVRLRSCSRFGFDGIVRVLFRRRRRHGGASGALVDAGCQRSRRYQFVYCHPYVCCTIPREHFRPITRRSDLVFVDLNRGDRHGSGDSAIPHEGPERVHSVVQAIVCVLRKWWKRRITPCVFTIRCAKSGEQRCTNPCRLRI